jgi:hypothetical protein
LNLGPDSAFILNFIHIDFLSSSSSISLFFAKAMFFFHWFTFLLGFQFEFNDLGAFFLSLSKIQGLLSQVGQSHDPGEPHI